VFSGPFAYLNYRDFVQVALFGAHDAESDFAWLFDNMKDRFKGRQNRISRRPEGR
jgi:hypothetical protein